MGEVLSPAKDKWIELGPLRLEDIIAMSDQPVNTNLPFGQSNVNPYIIGQVDMGGKVSGVGKEINNTIYEGQF